MVSICTFRDGGSQLALLLLAAAVEVHGAVLGREGCFCLLYRSPLGRDASLWQLVMVVLVVELSDDALPQVEQVRLVDNRLLDLVGHLLLLELQLFHKGSLVMSDPICLLAHESAAFLASLLHFPQLFQTVMLLTPHPSDLEPLLLL